MSKKDFVIINGVLESYKGSDTHVEIPDGVKRIYNKRVGVFAYNENIISVKLPEGLEEIGPNTFQGCSKLKEINLPESLRRIQDSAFAECKALENVKLPDGLMRIGEGAFSKCGKNMRSLILPVGLTEPLAAYVAADQVLLIPQVRFSAENDIYASIYLRGSLQTGNARLLTIGQETVVRKLVANNECKWLFDTQGNFNWNMYDIGLADNTAKVKLGAIFRTLAMAYRLRYPDGLTEIHRDKFRTHVCENIKKIAPYVNIIPEDGMVAFLEDIGAIHEENRKTLLPLMGMAEASAPKAKKASPKAMKEKTAVEEGVKTPAQLKKEWTTKKLADGTLSLNSYKGTDTVVEVPAYIGEDRVTVIGDECFYCGAYGRASEQQKENRKKITSVMIPEGITEIGEYAFCLCESLETVVIPASLKKMGPWAFLQCSRLKTISIPDHVELEEFVFCGCAGLADEQGLVIAGNVLFSCFGGGDVVIPGNVKRIERSAFRDLETLKSIVLPEALLSIPNSMVENCPQLERITIPAGVMEGSVNMVPWKQKLEIHGYSGSYAEELCQKSNGKFTFISLGDAPKEVSDFVIRDGVLLAYRGNDRVVTVPDHVKEIGAIGTGWDSKGAFQNKKELAQVVLPEGLEVIGDNAFTGCRKLHDIQIPDTVVRASRDSFSETAWLRKHPDDVIYAGKVMLCLNKPDIVELIVRPGTVSIGARACGNIAPSIRKIVLPEGLEHIGDGAFDGCWSLKELVIPGSVREIGKDAFHGPTILEKCSGDILRRNVDFPAAYKKFYTGEAEDTAWIILCQKNQSWTNAVREAMNDHPETITPVISHLTKLIGEWDVLEKTAAGRVVTIVQECYEGADRKALQELYEVLKKKCPNAAKTLDASESFRACMEGKKEENLHPMEAMVAANLQHTPGFNSVMNLVPGGIPYKDSGELCARRVLAFVVYEYFNQYDPASVRYVSEYKHTCKAYRLSPVADAVAAALDSQKLQEFLQDMAQKYGGAYWLPYARYADDKHTVSLLSQMREWDTWWKYGSLGRKNIIIARSGLLLNDTKAAMIHLDQTGNLQYYAKMRNTDAETIRDTVLADFGFDENREITYDLGGNRVIVHIEDDLKLSLLDTATGKNVKSLPKKNADPALYEKAKSDLSDLKKSVKKVVTNRKNILFADFLSGEKKDAEKWKKSYLGNPVLNAVAQLIVWSQNGKTFTLTKDGAVDSIGSEYTITEEPICVAHPIEMRDEISSWQSYFTGKGLKQPFEQVWEPAYDPQQILPNRYEGFTLNVYKLANKEQHGISVWGLRDYSEFYGFSLKDCEMEQQGSEWRFIHGISDDVTFELGKFTFETFTRQVNHIVYLFDKWTVTDRLLQDDVSVVEMLCGFTPAQIQEFIRLTSEKGCSNCTAMLLDYQHQNFEDLDPLAEFTLDL